MPVDVTHGHTSGFELRFQRIVLLYRICIYTDRIQRIGCGLLLSLFHFLLPQPGVNERGHSHQ